MFCKPLGGSLVPPPFDVECWHHTLFWKAGKQFPWLACHFLLWVIIIDAWLDLIHQCCSWWLNTQIHIASWDGTPHPVEIGQILQRRTAGRMMQGTALC